jgi:transporter family protein
MRRFDHNAVQVYYTFYQAIMMLVVWAIMNRRNRKQSNSKLSTSLNTQLSTINFTPILFISIFLVISDNVYMLALSYPDSMIAVVSTIRRGGTIIGFAYGLLFLKEPDPLRKLLCMFGISLALLCLARGAL